MKNWEYLMIAHKAMEKHPIAPTLLYLMNVLKKEEEDSVSASASAPEVKIVIDTSAADNWNGKRVLLFSNVEATEKIATRPDDILVFLNKAVGAEKYRNDVAEAKILYRRSDKESYGVELEYCENRTVFGGKDVPSAFLDSLKAGYDWKYPIEPGKTRCATTGYMVAKYLRERYPDRELFLVNFGYEVKKSSYRCPYHNWEFEAQELKQFQHVYTAATIAAGNSKKRIFYQTSGWLGDNIYASAVIENIARSGKFAVNVKTNKPELWANCPWLDRSITEANADYVLKQHNLYGWRMNTPHIIKGVTDRVSHDTGVKIPIVTLKPSIYMDLPKERLIDGDYVLINTGWQNSAETKKWNRLNWLRLLDLCPELKFVQFGQKKNHCTPLPGAVNLIDKTSIPDLCRLVRDAACVISPPSGCIHIAGALNVPFISLAGGREPASLVSYDCGTVLSTCEKLECCKKGGCHRNHFSGENRVCSNFCDDGETIPTANCMMQITPEEVRAELLKLLKKEKTNA